MKHKKLVGCLLPLVLGLGSQIACLRTPQDYVSRGDEAFKAGKYEDAVLNYRRAIQKDSKLGDPYVKLAHVALRQEKVVDAYAALSQATVLMPDRDDVKAELARICLGLYIKSEPKSQRLYDQLKSLSEQLLKRNPASYDGLRIQGQLADLDGRREDALAAFQKADHAKPRQPENVLNMVQGLFATGKDQEGEALARSFLAERREFSPLYDALYRYYADRNRVADAESLLNSKAANLPGNPGPLLQLASHYHNYGKLAELDSVLARLRALPGGRVAVGDFYQQRRLYEDAIREYKAAESAEPKQIAHRKKALSVLMAQEKITDAAALAERLVAEDPKDEELRYIRAILFIQQGRPANLKTAVQDLKLLVEAKPDNALYHFALGRALQESGDVPAAQKEFSEAGNKRRGYLEPRFSLAEMALNQENYAEALTKSEEVLAISSDNPRGQVYKAAALMGMGRLSEAGTILNLLAKRFPGNEDVSLQRAVLHVYENRLNEAEALAKRLYRPGQNDLRALRALVEVAFRRKQPEQALSLIRADLAVKDRQLARVMLGVAAMRARQLDLAAAELQKAASAEPDSPVAYFYLGQALSQKGDRQGAVANLRKASELAPSNPMALLLYGQSLEYSGRANEAMGVYKNLLQVQPTNLVALNNLAFLMADSGGNLDEAMSLIQRALQKSPQQPNFSDTLGWIYYKKNVTNSALHLYQNLVKQNPENPVFRYHLAMTLIQAGDRPAARKELEAAKSKKPAQPVTQMIDAALNSIS